jgi:hypothetical protein
LQYRLLWETGRVDNLLRAAGEREGSFQGRVFNDSDVYKWLEAASWSLAAHADQELRGKVDEIVPIVAAAQRPDGYLNAYFTREHAGEHRTDFDQHEMHCAEHVLQAAVAHHTTGSPQLLDVAIRFAALLGPAAEGKRVAADGRPEVEMPSSSWRAPVPSAQQNADKSEPKSTPVGVCWPPALGIAPRRVWRTYTLYAVCPDVNTHFTVFPIPFPPRP